MFRFFESIYADSSGIRNLGFHQARLDITYSAHYDKPNTLFNLSELIELHLFDNSRKLKIKFLYNESDFLIHVEPYIPRRFSHFHFVFDPNIHYNYKYCDRKKLDHYLTAERSCPVFITSKKEIMDTHYSNIVFFDGRTWFTPSTFLLKGTMRDSLISNGILSLRSITIRDLERFTHFKLINSMNSMEDSFLYSITYLKQAIRK
ncbi:MAG TPA: aminotransferase class IV [Saprospiraceae bacterium]|nr:aminotransferase class IV [Saprospiraceae bacterium]